MPKRFRKYKSKKYRSRKRPYRKRNRYASKRYRIKRKVNKYKRISRMINVVAEKKHVSNYTLSAYLITSYLETYHDN